MKIPKLSETNTPLTQLYQRHCAGDTEATERLFVYFAERLSRLAQQHLGQKMAPRVDGDDVMQSALKSFFLRASADQFQIVNSQDLWKLLVTITVRKTREQVRWHTAAVRSVDREVPQPLVGEASLVDLLTEEPTAEQGLACAEEIERLMKDRPEGYAQVLGLRLADYKRREIISETGKTKATIETILTDVKDRMRRRLDELS